MAVIPTSHAVARMSQRGLGNDDIELVLYMASEVEGGFLVTERDFQRFDRELKKRRDRAKKLIGKRVVFNGQFLITVYHAEPTKKKRLLRDGREMASID